MRKKRTVRKAGAGRPAGSGAMAPRPLADQGPSEGEEALKQIVEQLPFPMEICDARGTVTMVNNASLRLFGLDSADKIVGRLNFFDDPLLEKKGLVPLARKAFAGETVLIPEVRIGPEDEKDQTFKLRSKESLFEVVLFPVFGADGKVSRVVVIRKDITLKRRQDEELARSQKIESLGLLASGIAHDFNNLLAAIFGYVDLARMLIPESGRPAEYLDKALSAFQRAKDLTRQLLTFSKGDTPIFKPADIGRVLKDSLDLSLSGANVRCEMFLPDGLDQVMIDEGQMSQVFSNLLINARQAMPKGGVITVRAVNIRLPEAGIERLPPGPYVMVSIEDQGVGIPEDDLPRIFDPFYTTKQDGSGLGLTISHSIVAKHGGLLRASSRLGEGSVFSIVLPVSAAPVVGGSGHDDRSPEKFSGDVLVMDDEEIVGKALAEMLKLIGFSVSVCGDGGQAVALYSERLGKGRKFDAVILDLTVPGGKGGLESGREILDLDPSAVLIMSSGYSRDAVMSDPLKFGFQAFISKPFRMSDVRSVFASLRHRGAGRPERSPEP